MFLCYYIQTCMSKYILEPSVFIKMAHTPLSSYGIQHKVGFVKFPEPINVVQYSLTPSTIVHIGYVTDDNEIKFVTHRNDNATMETYYAISYEIPLRIISLDIKSVEGFMNITDIVTANYRYIIIIVILLLAYYNYDNIKKFYTKN